MLDSACVAASLEELRGWVEVHHMTWETRSRRDAAHDQRGAEGIELTLLGRHPDGRFPVGDDGYLLVYERLRAVALHVLESVPGARHRMDPFDAAVRLRPEQGWTPEVELSLVIEDAAHPPSEAGRERPLLTTIESGLERLGVQRKHWR